MPKILIVEDEPGIAFGLESDLQTEGYEVAVVGDGAEAIRRARAEAFDVILLDVMLPNKDGFEVCRELRHGGMRTPIILLTAKTQEAEKVMGLDVGADDYVTKPFSPRELRARIRALLRRAAPENGEEVLRPLRTRPGPLRAAPRRPAARHHYDGVEAAGRICPAARSSADARPAPGRCLGLGHFRHRSRDR
jgi:two-component system alkaline phosphatase synthesis response regulator PhoP